MAFFLINMISALIIIFIFILIMVFDYKNNKVQTKKIRLITLTGILVALVVSLNALGSIALDSFLPPKIFEIKIGNFILVLIGLFCGGLLGFIGGITNDVVGLLFMKNGTPCLFFTLTSILWCVMPYYLIVWFCKIYYTKKVLYHYYMPLAYGLTLLLVSGTDPIILTIMYNLKWSFWVLYGLRIIKYPFFLLLNSALIITCYAQLSKSLQLEHQFQKKYFAVNTEMLEYNNPKADKIIKE